MPKH
ncbi:uncharacterized protein FFM5_15354 [Fusarium fujikuroi]|jgi:hypothetical protein